MYDVSVVKRFPREGFISKKKTLLHFGQNEGLFSMVITLKLYFMGVEGKNYETFVSMNVVTVIRGIEVYTP